MLKESLTASIDFLVSPNMSLSFLIVASSRSSCLVLDPPPMSPFLVSRYPLLNEAVMPFIETSTHSASRTHFAPIPAKETSLPAIIPPMGPSGVIEPSSWAAPWAAPAMSPESSDKAADAAVIPGVGPLPNKVLIPLPTSPKEPDIPLKPVVIPSMNLLASSAPPMRPPNPLVSFSIVSPLPLNRLPMVLIMPPSLPSLPPPPNRLPSPLVIEDKKPPPSLPPPPNKEDIPPVILDRKPPSPPPPNRSPNLPPIPLKKPPILSVRPLNIPIIPSDLPWQFSVITSVASFKSAAFWIAGFSATSARHWPAALAISVPTSEATFATSWTAWPVLSWIAKLAVSVACACCDKAATSVPAVDIRMACTACIACS